MLYGLKVNKQFKQLLKITKLKCIILYGFIIIGTKMKFFMLFFTFKIYYITNRGIYFVF